MIPLDRVRELLAAATAEAEGRGRPSVAARDALRSMAPLLARDVLSLADALATAERERDEARERDAFLTRERIAVATALDVPYATDLGEAVATRLARLTAERDTARSALDGLVAAVRAEREAYHNRFDAETDPRVTAAQHRAYNERYEQVCSATDALLDAALAPTTVPAEVVRAYLTAQEAALSGRDLSRQTDDGRVAVDVELYDARAAIDAALARCP